MFRKIIVSALILSVFLFAVTANGIQEQPSKDSGLRIVSLGPNTTEIISALGAEDMLVGRTDQCNRPSSVLSLPSIGGAWNISVEKILSLNPTLVLAPYELDGQVTVLLENAGIKVRGKYFENTTGGIFDLITFIGEETGKEKEAAELNRNIGSSLQAVSKSVEGFSRPTVYLVISYGSFDSTATGETFLNELIDIAGGINIAAASRGWQYSKELLISEDPEYIILIPTTDNPEKEIEDFSNTPPYNNLSAVKNGKVFFVEADSISRQGPRIVEAAEAIKKIIHE